MKTLLTGPNAITSLVAVNADTIFTTDNCVIIYEANGAYRSWVPGRDLNAFSAFEVGIGYIAIMKQETDVTGSFSDGLPAGTSGVIISNQTGTNQTFNFVDDAGVVKGTLQTIQDSHGQVINTLPTGATSIKMTSDISGIDVVQAVYFSPNQVNYGVDQAANIFLVDNTIQITDYLDLAALNGGFLYYIFIPRIAPTAETFLEVINFTAHNIQLLTQDNWALSVTDAYGNAFSEIVEPGGTVKINKSELDNFLTPTESPDPVTGINIGPYPLGNGYDVIRRIGNNAAEKISYPDPNIGLISWAGGEMADDCVFVVIIDHP